MVYCCVVGCKSNSSKSKKSTENSTKSSVWVGFHQFPSREISPERYKSWVVKIKRKNFTPTKFSRVCSIHFTEDDFEISSVLKKRLMVEGKFQNKLKKSAVPSLFLAGENEGETSSTSYASKKRKQISCSPKQQISEIMQSQEGSNTSRGTSPKKMSYVDVYSSSSLESNSNSAANPLVEMDLFSFKNNNEIREGMVSSSVQCELGKETFCSVARKHQQDQDLDTSFIISDCSESSDSSDSESCDVDNNDNYYENNDIFEKNVDMSDNVFLVFGESILLLFQKCQRCGKEITERICSTKGTLLIIKTICIDNHTFTWHSQTTSNKFAMGNVKLASAMYLTGMSFTLFASFAQTFNLTIFSNSTFYTIVRKFVAPVIRQTFHDKRKSLIEGLNRSGEDIWVSGDGQYDSPGFCAKYATYSIMNLKDQQIIDFIVVQKGMVTGDLEKTACEKILQRLTQEKDMNITLFLSDRHRGIRLLLRTKFPHIIHQFDVWHMAKSLTKKLKNSEKKAPLLLAWRSSIINHLWWSAQTCAGNQNLLVEKFTSLLKHVCNIHTWDGKEFTKCEHGPISEEDDRDIVWLSPNSNDFQILKSTVEQGEFLKDIRHLNHYCHTGALESYHNERLKYLPKRNHFSYDGMIVRGMLAILDHNHNIGRKKISEGQKFSKSQKKWLSVPIYERKSNEWREKLMRTICDLVDGNATISVNPKDEYAGTIPKNIAATAKPDLEETRQTRFSRFKYKKNDVS